jgi:putative transposase
MSVHQVPRFDVARHHRRSIRKRTHDYTSPGLYFVTFCTHERYPLFGQLVQKQVELNEMGCFAYDHWNSIPGHHAHVVLHAFTIMPEHMHGIIELLPGDRSHHRSVSDGQRPLGPVPGSLGAIVGSYRAGVSREINRMVVQRRPLIWQRGYHDIIIRNDVMLDRITRYIHRHPTMVRLEH